MGEHVHPNIIEEHNADKVSNNCYMHTSNEELLNSKLLIQ